MTTAAAVLAVSGNTVPGIAAEPAGEFAVAPSAEAQWYDVIVVDGGVSGAVADIASVRQGARTLIVEKMGFLGGVLTAGGVGPMMTFHAGRQVARGIADEVVERLKALGGDRPDTLRIPPAIPIR